MSPIRPQASGVCPICGSVKRETFAEHGRSARVSELLQCNDIPSEKELSDFQDTIRRGPELLADIDDRIMRLRELLDTLVQDRKSVERDIKDAKIVSSPVRRLLPDVLRSICSKAVPFPSDIMSPSFDFCDSLDTRRAPWTISQVCRRWRSIIVSAPELWSSMSIVISESGTNSSSSDFYLMFLFAIRLRRSQSFPLTLSFWSARDVTKHPLLALISSHAPALKNLRIHIPITSFQELSGCRGCLDQLCHLILESHEQQGWAMGCTINAFKYAPKLQMLNMSILPFPDAMEFPWSQLSHYGLQIDGMLYLMLLRRVENVKSLDIRNREKFSLPKRYKRVSLPCLTSLKVTSQNTAGMSSGVCAILSALSIPNLVDLHLVYSGVPGFPYIKMSNMITSLTITQLSSLTGSYTFKGLPLMLSNVPNLKHLTLKSAGGLSLDDISSLNPSPAFVPLPHLRTLDISGCKLNFDHSVFVEIIKARRQGGNPKCDQVETVHLGSPLTLKVFTYYIWKGLLEKGLKVVYGATK